MSRFTQVNKFSLTPVSHPIDFKSVTIIILNMSTQTFQGLYSDLIGTGLDRIGLGSNWIWQEADVIWS